MATEVCYGIFCFVPLKGGDSPKIFEFSEFLTAVALLAVVYTVTDVRYKFRIAVTPGWIYLSTFALLTLIGLETLLSEVWIAGHWWVPRTAGLTYALWQGLFGVLFLGTFATWMYYAFIRPPVFGRRNARRFARELYRYILRGNPDELKVIANELAKSASPLVQFSSLLPSNPDQGEPSRKLRTEDAADQVLMLIANRKFCRQIVAFSPVTAQAFFSEMVEAKKFNIRIGTFAKNISSEAVRQNESFLYIEADGYTSGLLGYLKPVSQAVYGNYWLVETIGRDFQSPLDIDYEEREAWDATQWQAYCRATLITLEAFLGLGKDARVSYTLNRALHNIQESCSHLYRLNGVTDAYNSDIFKKFRIVVDFVRSAINLIDKQKEPPIPLPWLRENKGLTDIYDQLAELIFEMCVAASAIDKPPDLCWSIQYVSLWGQLFSFPDRDGRGRKIVQFKVRRLLYDEIVELCDLPNYKGARILGFCLHVLHLKTGRDKSHYGRESYALAKAVQSWTQKWYLWLHEQNPDVAESALTGRLSFDDVGKRLVYTYFKGLNRVEPKTYLELEPSPIDARSPAS